MCARPLTWTRRIQFGRSHRPTGSSAPTWSESTLTVGPRPSRMTRPKAVTPLVQILGAQPPRVDPELPNLTCRNGTRRAALGRVASTGATEIVRHDRASTRPLPPRPRSRDFSCANDAVAYGRNAHKAVIARGLRYPLTGQSRRLVAGTPSSPTLRALGCGRCEMKLHFLRRSHRLFVPSSGCAQHALRPPSGRTAIVQAPLTALAAFSPASGSERRRFGRKGRAPIGGSGRHGRTERLERRDPARESIDSTRPHRLGASPLPAATGRRLWSLSAQIGLGLASARGRSVVPRARWRQDPGLHDRRQELASQSTPASRSRRGRARAGASPP